MDLIWIAVILAAALISCICYRMAFRVRDQAPPGPDEFPIPHGEVYEPFRETMVGWMKEARAMPQEKVSTRSFDGLSYPVDPEGYLQALREFFP